MSKMKCSELLIKGTKRLKEKGIVAPRLEAEVLLAFAWGRERTHLLIFSDDLVPEEVEWAFNELLSQRSRGVPVAYLTGEKEFMSLPFYVNQDVLIPRPETELLVERVLNFLAGVQGDGLVTEPESKAELPPHSLAVCCQKPKNSFSGKRIAPLSAGGDMQMPLVADVGTGSGAVAVSLAYYDAGVHLVATDISPAALQVARRNAKRHGVAERIEFLQGDLLAPLLQQGITGVGTAIAANLPYIPTADLQGLPLDVQHEPIDALDGGWDGLDHYRRLLPQAAAFLAPKGLLACEVGVGQAELLAGIFVKEGWTEIDIIKDYAGRERIVTAINC